MEKELFFVGMIVIPKAFSSWLECLLDASKKEY